MIKIIKTTATSNLYSDLIKILEPLGSITNFIRPGDKVLVKPNFNTADPFPASSSFDFIRAVINIIKTVQPKKIILGDSCTISQKTENVFNKLGIYELGKELGIGIENFDQGKFIKKKLPGKYLKSIRIPATMEKVDKIIILPCLKTHRYAGFTMSLKLGVGLMKKIDRARLHMNHLEEKIAEINLAYQPSLILLDGRKAFVENGPEKGTLVEPNILLAGTDRIAMDIEALKILKSYSAANKIGGDIWQLTQIKRAVELNLGITSASEYQIINT